MFKCETAVRYILSKQSIVHLCPVNSHKYSMQYHMQVIWKNQMVHLHFYFSHVTKALLTKLKMPNLLELIWKDELIETKITLFCKWPATFLCLFKARIWFSKIKCRNLSCVQRFTVMVILRFVDILELLAITF